MYLFSTKEAAKQRVKAAEATFENTKNQVQQLTAVGRAEAAIQKSSDAKTMVQEATSKKKHMRVLWSNKPK